MFIYIHTHTHLYLHVYICIKRENVYFRFLPSFISGKELFLAVLFIEGHVELFPLCAQLLGGETQKLSEAECTGSPELSVAQRGVLRPDVVGHVHNDQRSGGKRPCSINAGWELEVTLPVCTIRSSWLGLWPSRKEGPLECRRWNQLVFFCCFQSDMMKQLSMVSKWRVNQPPPPSPHTVKKLRKEKNCSNATIKTICVFLCSLPVFVPSHL